MQLKLTAEEIKEAIADWINESDYLKHGSGSNSIGGFKRAVKPQDITFIVRDERDEYATLEGASIDLERRNAPDTISDPGPTNRTVNRRKS